jgi:hypothetical protein
MNDNDLIRRGDALAEVNECGEAWWNARDAIAALPAVPAVRVKPLEFDEWDAEMRVAKTPFGKYRIGGLGGGFNVSGPYGWRWPCGSEKAALKACQDHYEKGIRAALDTPAPAPDVAGLVQAAKAVTTNELSGSDDELRECGCEMCNLHLTLRVALAAMEARNG